MSMNSPRWTGWAIKGAGVPLCLMVMGCDPQALKDDLGFGRQAPDEYQVVERAPLSVPPNFHLRPPRPGALRPQAIDIREQAECISGDVWSRCELLDASLSGAMLDFGDQSTPAQGDFISLDMRGVGMLHAEVMRVWQSRVGLRFDDVSAEARDRLIRRLYTEGLQANVDNAAGAKLITMKLLSRAFGRSPA